jgi:hypothetical protein
LGVAGSAGSIKETFFFSLISGPSELHVDFISHTIKSQLT